jgi:hypothetical protein
MSSREHNWQMEHRWGTRIGVHIPVRVTAPHVSTASIGRLTNLSLSGAFITGFWLRPLARIQVSVEWPLPLQPALEKLPAFVARVCEEGAGIMWCEFAPRAVVELLRAMTGILSDVGGVARPSIEPVTSIQSFAARN